MNRSDESKRPNVFYRFIRFILLAVRNYFVAVGVLVTAIPFILYYSLTHQTEHKVTADFDYSKANPAQLKLDLKGSLAEREPGFSEQLFSQFFGEPTALYVPEIKADLKQAAADERVGGLDIDIGSLHASLAELAELRRAIDAFRASGKPVHVMLEDPSDWDYYLASAGSTITINPASPVMIPGPVFHLIYFGDALRKLGVDMDVIRAGKYKSAFEPFVRNEPSEATLEEYRSMEESLRSHIVEVVAKSRNKNPQVVRGWLKKSIFTAKEAIAAGIVDNVGYAIEQPIKKPGSQKNAKPISLDDYADAAGEPKKQEVVEGKGGIALIEAVGEINMTQPQRPTSTEGIDPEDLHKRLKWAREDKDVKAVVLRVSSPGGSAVASDMIWNDVQELADAKPLVVSMGAYAASGGYFISVPARKIIAEPTTLTGSIGVIGMLPSFEQFKDKYGVSFHVVTQSDREKLLGNGTRASDADQALMEQTIDQVYHIFLEKVATGRKMKVSDVEALAQGRVYTGLEAKKLGLVDELGGLQTAFNTAKELAGLDVKKLYPVLHYKSERPSLSECLRNPQEIFRCLDDADVKVSMLRRLTSVFGQDGFADVGASWDLPGSKVFVAMRVKNWLAALQDQKLLTLWPGYLSTELDAR